MTGIEIPTHGEREYLRVFGVVAVYIAAGNQRGPCLIGYTRDLGRTRESIRDRWHWSIELPAAWWVADQTTAAAIIARVNETLPLDARGLFDIETDKLAEQIERRGRGLTRHPDAMGRVRAAVNRVDAVIEAANRAGELSWFNAAYRDWRTGEGASMAPAVSYGRARASLRDAVVRRIAAGGPVAVGVDLRSEVFPALEPRDPRAGPAAEAANGGDEGADTREVANRTGGPENGSQRVRTEANDGGRRRTLADDKRAKRRAAPAVLRS